ncbi:hypothetical protein ABZX92_37545 [Lentzea sp. NPDC006480]|uniref:hypothetical protein n=1 Tax=Lentzea sp. NPDC006480 TaxID=3157176 RepID=UPI0033A555C9
MLKAEKITDPVVDEIVEIACRECWRGTWETGEPVRDGKVDLPPELEAGELEPGR